MRRAAVLLPLLLLGACKDQPDFDARYDKANAEIEARAKAMDADVAEANQTATENTETGTAPTSR